MDFTKLLSLLEDRQIYFPRADQFEDPYEGAVPSSTLRAFCDWLRREEFSEAAIEKERNRQLEAPKKKFISCWFTGEHESAAMWKLYLQSPEGVAIRTDHNLLCSALEASPLTARTSLIKYIDYNKDHPFMMDNMFYPFLHKRISFAHENELRAIISSTEVSNEKKISKDDLFVTVDIVPQVLIKAIHISPTAPLWFGALVERILRRYGMGCPVERSNLYERPVY